MKKTRQHVKFKRQLWFKEKMFYPGDVVELNIHDAAALLKRRFVIEVDSPEEKREKELKKKKETKEFKDFKTTK